jgi:para-aminobenzoate synthetase component 1
MLNRIKSFNIFSFLDSNGYRDQYSQYEWLAAVDALHAIKIDDGQSANLLEQFAQDHPGWLFGHMNYPDSSPDQVGFPAAYFFQPRILITCKENQVEIITQDTDADEFLYSILQTDPAETKTSFNCGSIRASMPKEAYLRNMDLLRHHLQQGDCYEINFCQEFELDQVQLDSLDFYLSLMDISPNPFSAWYRMEDMHCICASPERYLQKTGNRLISQPIKGTARRQPEDKVLDDKISIELQHSMKEKRENVMIVDLVRNDLSMVAARGSVRVSELMGLYRFPHVFQLISTVEATLTDSKNWKDALLNCFPMGSMTGAPKKRVMELIKTYESGPRGLFSGTIGYIDPERNFDFNVVIRSAFYHELKQIILLKAGGGITIQSESESEYQESILKLEAMLKLFKTIED